MPSSWHQSQGGIHQESLFCVFSPVPGALSCDRTRPPVLTLELTPQPQRGLCSARLTLGLDLPEGTALQ